MDGIVIPGFDPGDTARRIAVAATSSTGSVELGEDLGLAALAVMIGGLEAMRFYGSTDLDVKDPTGRGPVTRADRASHQAIVDLLRERRPEDAVLSEEGDGLAPAGDPARRWIVDPLDGTQEFMAGIGEFSVMVGMAVEGSALLGAVYRPDPGRLYAGVADRAAWRVGNGGSPPDLRPLRVAPSAGGLRFARSRSHPDARLRERVRAPVAVAAVDQGRAAGRAGHARREVAPLPDRAQALVQEDQRRRGAVDALVLEGVAGDRELLHRSTLVW